MSAFDDQCLEVTDRYLVDLRKRLEMDQYRITICSNCPVAFVSVVFVMVSTQTNCSSASLFFFGTEKQVQRTRKIPDQIWKKSTFRTTDLSETFRLDIDCLVLAERHDRVAERDSLRLSQA